MKKVLIMGALILGITSCDKEEMEVVTKIDNNVGLVKQIDIKPLEFNEKSVGGDDINVANSKELAIFKKEFLKSDEMSRSVAARLVTDTHIIEQYVKIIEGEVNWNDAANFRPLNDKPNSRTFYYIVNTGSEIIYFDVSTDNSILYVKTDIPFRLRIITAETSSKLGTARNQVIYKSDFSDRNKILSPYWPGAANKKYVYTLKNLVTGAKDKIIRFKNGRSEFFINKITWNGPILNNLVYVGGYNVSLTANGNIKYTTLLTNAFDEINERETIVESSIVTCKKWNIVGGIYTPRKQIKSIWNSHVIYNNGDESKNRYFSTIKNGIRKLKWWDKTNRLNGDQSWSFTKYTHNIETYDVLTEKRYQKQHFANTNTWRYEEDYFDVDESALINVNFYFE